MRCGDIPRDTPLIPLIAFSHIYNGSAELDMYALGIDLGTTFTAAAVWRDGRAEISSLGSRGAAIPSVVVLREDETIITGETANRRALTSPHRVAREFKRRLGDTTPILLAGVPYSAEALMARVLRAVVDEVTAREGGPPDAVCVSHPANWGPYKTDLLQQAVRSANLEEATFTIEPVAAAVFYARQQRMPDDAVIAVYDLGGGTFDAAVLRKKAGGFEILGRPEGIERLGGIDFDAAVFAHVARALEGALEGLDDEDPAAISAVARLKEECTQAKEALSADTDTTIPVLLPKLSTEVRLTRAELEGMVRPALQDTIDALRRALRSAGITPEELHSVLLVGGSSRMPIVSQLVGAELGRPVAVDAHPKHAVALGAAMVAGVAMSTTADAADPAPVAPTPVVSTPVASTPVTPTPVAPTPVTPTPVTPTPVTPTPVTPAPIASTPVAPTPVAPTPVTPTPVAPTPTPSVSGPGTSASGRPVSSRPGSSRPTSSRPVTSRPTSSRPVTAQPTEVFPAASPSVGAQPTTAPSTPKTPKIKDTPKITPVSSGPFDETMIIPAAVGYGASGPRNRDSHPTAAQQWSGAAARSGSGSGSGGGSGFGAGFSPGRRRVLAGAAAAAVAVIALSAAAIAALQNDDKDNLAPTGANGKSTAQATPKGKATPTKAAGNALPADERCSAEIKANTRWVCLISAKFKGETLTIRYRANFAGAEPNVDGGYHLHIYGGDGVNPPAEIEGRQAMNPGKWYVEDQNPSVRTASSTNYRQAIGDAPKVCARIATSSHMLVQDKNGTYVTGNCVPIDRTDFTAPAGAGKGSASGTGLSSQGHATHTAAPTPTDWPTPTDTPTESPTTTWTPEALVTTAS